MPLTPGSVAPDAPVRDFTPSPRPLAELWADGPALLFFYGEDCPASPLGAVVLPRFAALPGLTVVAISQDGIDAAGEFAEAHGFGGKVVTLADDAPFPASRSFGVRATPTWVLVGPGGRVEAVAEGWSRDEANALAARAAALVGASPREVSTAADGGPALRPG